jgi:hypothetical protein
VNDTDRRAIELLKRANRVLAEYAADEYIDNGELPATERALYVAGFSGRGEAVAGVALLLGALEAAQEGR